MENIIYRKLSYDIIGACMEVHNHLGKGHKENIYSDALQHEFSIRNINLSREMRFQVSYKEKVLEHYYFADFVVNDKLILEIKAVDSLSKSHIKQTLNYLAASKLKLGLLVNFGQDSLEYKRVVL